MSNKKDVFQVIGGASGLADNISDNPGSYIDGAYVLPAHAGEREVWKAFRYRLYPKPDQVAYFNRLFGCCRWIYNHFLQVRIDAWEAKQADPDVKIPTWQDMAYELTRLKREIVGSDGEHFLRKVDSTALVYELKFLDTAFVGFFKRVKKGVVPPGFPRFKGRNTKRSATVSFPNPDYVASNRIRFAKLGWVRANIHRPLEGHPISATISVDAAERWWVSIKCKTTPKPAAPALGGAVALNVGADPWIVTSDGEAIDLAPAGQAARIAREKRRLSKCEGPVKNKPASARYERQRLRTAKLFAREADRRADEINNLTSRLVEAHGTIVVRGAGASELARQLRYKCTWHGRAYVELPDSEHAPDGAPAPDAVPDGSPTPDDSPGDPITLADSAALDGSPIPDDLEASDDLPAPTDRATQAQRDLQEGLALLERAQAGG